MFVIPKEGLLVPNPDNKGKPLKAEGENVSETRYWHRRRHDGDVEIGKEAKAKAVKTSKA